ncbi:MAG: phosphate/phosphite/phosphonate ABC transporter substrate-binding protein [Beijerinckiaceae bacterium]
MIHRRTILAGAAGIVAMPSILRAQSRPVLKIGLGPQQPTQQDTKRVWEPIYKAVCAKVGYDAQITVANDWAGIAVAIGNDQIDLAQMGPWGYVLAKNAAGARAINMMLIQGRPYYKAIIVARPGLTVAKFPEDARGLAMQMLDVGSTSGWLVPTHWLKAKGIEPKTYFGKYAEGASAAAAQLATITGQVDLATGWDTHRNTMIRNGTIKEDANRVVWESDPLPNEPVVVRKGLPDDLANKLQEAFASLTPTELESLPWPYSGFVKTTHQPYEVLEKMGRDLNVLKTS